MTITKWLSDTESASRAVRSAILALAACLLTSLAPAALAAEGDEELPGRVGRIADVSGELFHAPVDNATDWSPVGLNYPVTSGDHFWVSGEGRAEIDYGGGQFRLAGETNLHVSRLDDRQLALFVAQGRLIVRLRMLDAGEVATIDTPNTQIQLTRPGLYRVEVTPDRGATSIVVREGEAVAAITGGAQQILPGQTGILSGPQPEYADVRNATGIDGFDSWSANRDRRYERTRTANHVSRQMVGWADLEEYGRWDQHTSYGAVWYPAVVADGWAPYRYGRWVWSGAWGWTWVDDAPWGYAPFHYGRWVYIGNRWGWCPGTYVARPVWAPALVGWVGGAGWGVGVGTGPLVGWVPLGWGDRYVPTWGHRGCGTRCWNQYNRPFAVNRAERPGAPPTHYSNGHVPGAVTAVAGATFAASRPVAPNVVRVPPPGAGGLPIAAAAPALRPTRIPDQRPVAGTPPPASTFYPTSKPRLAIDRPVSRAPDAGFGGTGTGMPAVPGMPGAGTTGRPVSKAEPMPAPGLTSVPPARVDSRRVDPSAATGMPVVPDRGQLARPPQAAPGMPMPKPMPSGTEAKPATPRTPAAAPLAIPQSAPQAGSAPSVAVPPQRVAPVRREVQPVPPPPAMPVPAPAPAPMRREAHPVPPPQAMPAAPPVPGPSTTGAGAPAGAGHGQPHGGPEGQGGREPRPAHKPAPEPVPTTPR
jgi:hypothetical protein